MHMNIVSRETHDMNNELVVLNIWDYTQNKRIDSFVHFF